MDGSHDHDGPPPDGLSADQEKWLERIARETGQSREQLLSQAIRLLRAAYREELGERWKRGR